MNLFLHVGLHKTGTTFLQQRIFPAWSDLYYIGKPYGSEFFEPVLRDGDVRSVLMSNEQFSSLPIYPELLDPALRKKTWHEQRKDILSRLKQLFPQACVMMGLREPAEFAESVYSQYVFRGGAADLDAYWHPNEGQGCLCLRDLEFDRLQNEVESLWSGAFFFDHADLRNRPADLLWAMAHFMGLDSIPDIVPGEVNPRLTQSQVEAMRAYSAAHDRQQMPSKEFYRGLRIARDGAPDSERFAFPASLRDEIRQLTDSSWQRAKARMALSA